MMIQFLLYRFRLRGGDDELCSLLCFAVAGELPLSSFPAEVGMKMCLSSGHRWSDGTSNLPLKLDLH